MVFDVEVYDVKGWKKSDGFPMIIHDITTSYFWSHQNYFLISFFHFWFSTLFIWMYERFVCFFFVSINEAGDVITNICYSWWINTIWRSLTTKISEAFLIDLHFSKFHIKIFFNILWNPCITEFCVKFVRYILEIYFIFNTNL